MFSNGPIQLSAGIWFAQIESAGGDPANGVQPRVDPPLTIKKVTYGQRKQGRH